MNKIKKVKRKITRGFKANFLTGLITILPIFITYVFFSWIMKFLHKHLNFIPQKLFPDSLLLIIVFEIVLLSLIIFAIYLIGLLASHYMGKQILKIGERILNRIPFIRTIYTGSKQIIESFMFKNKQKFMDVVLVEYPRKGIYVMGFVTGNIKVSGKKNQNLVPVFIPSTPNPTTGFLVLFKKSDVLPLKITPESAIKLIISGGIVGSNNLKTKS